MRGKFVYAFSYYCDNTTFNDALTWIYEDPKDAIDQLKREFIDKFKKYGDTVNEICNSTLFDEHDILTIGSDRAYIRVIYGGNTHYFIVTPYQIR